VITSPFDVLWTLQRRFASEDDEESREKLYRAFPEKSAKTLLTSAQIYVLLAFVVFLSFVVSHDPADMAFVAFLAINIFYAVTLSFKTLLFLIGFLRRNNTLEHAHYSLLEESELPVYSILIPLYKEKGTLTKLVESIRNLDYPKSKLDVKFVVEEDDNMTIEALKALHCESYFEIIRVPYSLPRTKPKACNYALRFARGTYVTIYDAEDTPHPTQLKKVIAKFRRLPKNVVCIQAKLNYFNRRENFITRMFAIEYASWFDFMLLGLEALNIPIPLGGTSNHFVLEKLRELGGWDPYNVTEDADLGVRLATYGYRVSVIDSLTLEEAPILVKAWLSQRSRWIKGYMQTYIVHMRHPIVLYFALGPTGFFGFQLFIGAPCILFLITPFIWLFWGIQLLGDWHIPAYFTGALYDVGMFNLVAGLILPIVFSLTVVIRSKWWDMTAYSFAFPLYWVLHSIASFKALWQLIFRPHYWEKTSHGMSQIAWKR
jgi:cellulose synthase/poly-beta-1,6-N-acetylglucosamine synthase-like glycosyltransferase